MFRQPKFLLCTTDGKRVYSRRRTLVPSTDVYTEHTVPMLYADRHSVESLCASVQQEVGAKLICVTDEEFARAVFEQLHEQDPSFSHIAVDNAYCQELFGRIGISGYKAQQDTATFAPMKLN